MAKKKTKSTPKSTTKSSPKKSSHGQLFDSHPNLIWLFPIFFIVGAVLVIMYMNSMKPVSNDNMLEANQIPQVDTTVVSPTEAMEAPSGY